jgi:hypothetical protein
MEIVITELQDDGFELKCEKGGNDTMYWWTRGCTYQTSCILAKCARSD